MSPDGLACYLACYLYHGEWRVRGSYDTLPAARGQVTKLRRNGYPAHVAIVTRVEIVP